MIDNFSQNEESVSGYIGRESEKVELISANINKSKEEVFDVLAEIVNESIKSGKKRMGAASLKSRLVKYLGDFDEKKFGFKRFKDFLLAAQEMEYIKVFSEGQVTWIMPITHGD